MKTTKYLLLIAFLFCFTLNLRAQSGTCGANLTWELVNDTLIITGSGAMDNSRPWSSYLSQIVHVSLPDGLTNICDNAFYQCSNLQSLVIPNTVTSIGYSAFDACTSLKQVTLGNAVETIGSAAFGSTAITTITLPSSVTSIEDYAFSYCKKLTEITIPGSVSSIGNYAFQYCEQLSKATIEEGVKSIGYSAFQYCSKMTDISLPSSLISIGSSAFSSCSALASVVIPEQITTIEASTFSHCSSLKEVTFPNNLQTIGDEAFYSCSFTHIDIPHSVASLGYSAFSGCDNLTSVTLPNSITNIPRNVFSSCTKLISVTIPEGVTTIGYGAFNRCNLLSLSLPNSLQTIENGAEYFAEGAFEGNENLTSVTIPDGVTTLGAYTFEYCSALSQVTLPDGLLSIGARAFHNCTSLRTINLGADLLTIGENAFENCYALSSIIVPDKVSIIPTYAFYNCSALSQVSLPKHLATIEVAAFMNCRNLSSIILPEGLTTIEGAAFYDCNLTNLTLPQSLRTIGDGVLITTSTDYHGAFEKNSNLTTITIPQSVTTLGSDAFAECVALSQVTLSEGLTTIGARAFYNCSALKTIQLPKSINSLVSAFSHCGLEEIEIPENVLILDGTFYECNKLTKVILPSSLTTIDDNSFYNCTSLTSITLPQTVRFIGSSAFYGCKSLSQINLPQEITTIEGGAFERCSALREVTIPNKITKIASSTFANCGSLVSIFLPRNISTIESYAFEYCTSLTELVLPDSLKSIGNYSCFRGCSALRSLTIPSSVTTLGSGLFEGCVSLSSVTMLPPTPPTTDYTFRYAPSTLKINLVCGSKEAYMADANWAALTYPINEISSNILTIKSNDNRMGEAYIPTPNTCDNDTAIIEALPREGYQFAAWHDGNTDNPRTILVTQDTTFTANFEPLTTYQLTVNYDPKQGHISGIGEYYPNEEATLTVTPLGGYRFKQWGDGNTDNPRTIIMTQDTTLEALFITGDYCGDDILYTFLNDTLALNGTGDMWNLSQYGWNMYADEVLALTLSDGITSLGTNAFMDLMFLPEVTIPASVKTIHKRAFENCRSLSSVMFAPNSQLQTIDHWAFYECINLKALEIPEGVTTIGNGAFYGCAYLDSIVLPASMMSIADNGFAQCTKLSAMIVHAVTPPEVDNKTFENVRRSIPVYVPFGTGATYRATPIWQEFDIREMGAESNDNKIFYTSTDGNIVTPYDETVFGANIISNTYESGEGIITFDGVVTSIGESAFNGCSALTSITIPHSVTSIGNYTFYYCSSLTSITIPESVTSIGSAFCGCSSLTSITIPYGVPTIEDNVFFGCSSLTSITIPESVTSIGIWSFSGCSSLTSITIPNSVMSIGNSAFFGCSSLTSITIPYGVPTIEDQVFSGCSSLTSITIPESVTSIGSYSFYGCSSLTSITIPESITNIGESAFSGCSSLTDSINIPNGVTTIEAGTFSGCSSLASITIPESITSIGHQAFWSCSSLASITIPNGVTTIGDYAFYDCHSLVSSISIPYGVTTIGEHTFYGCVSLPSISIPNSVTSIGYNAFKYCYSFTSVIIPNSVTSIENSAFQDCLSLTSVTIGSSVMTIGAEVFDECPLDTIYCYAITPPELFDEGVFQNYDAILYVSCESLEAYKADAIWGKFSNIQCIDSENPPCEEVSVDFNATFCGSFVWNGVVYTMAGDYVQTLKKTDGCDSIVTMHLLEDCPISPIDSCEDIIELDWRNGVQLSQLSSGWYKLYVGDIHANQSDITSLLINDLDCPATITRAFYAHCEDEESLFEGSATYELGATQQAMTYAEFAGMIPAYVDYLYLNIESIVEDCEPTPSSCEDAIEVELDYTSRIESPCEVWYRFGVHDLPMEVDFTPDADDSMSGPEFSIDFTCTPGVYDDPKVDSMMIELGKSEPGMTMPIELLMDWVNRNGKRCYNLYITQNYRNLFVQHGGITYNVPMYIKVMYFEPGEISFKRHDAKETIEETVTICDGESYTWDKDGMRYTESGNYITLSSDGETYYVLHLTVIEPQRYPVERITICEGETYIWRGMALSQGGSYTDVEQDPTTGCDIAIYTLLLTIEDCAPPCEDVDTEEYATICYGETFTWNGQSYSTTGEYTQTLSTTTGCDSTVTLYLTVLPATIIVEESVVINEEYLPYTWRDLQCYDTGTYTISTPFADYPYCDSVIYVLNLTVEAPNKCGDNLYWHYSNNTMTITGYGAMYDDPELLSYRTQGWYPSRVTHVSLSTEITHIGDVAFADCANLTNIDIPNSVTSIGDGAFSWTGLQSITIPASVTELGEQVFEACNDLHTILYEGNPIAINNQTVHPLIGCVHLDTVITPAALWHCTAADPALEARYGVPHKAHYIEVTDGKLTDQAVKYIAQNATTLEVLDLTNATNTTLPYGAWSNCYQLTQLYLPEVIETLPESMIEGSCRLLEIAIPATVTEIGNYAFAGCVNVWRMTVDAVIPPKVYENTFDGISRSISVQVPAGCEDLYREAEYWREFFVETDAQQSPQKAQKILREDQILILRNGKVYTTMGQLITNE